MNQSPGGWVWADHSPGGDTSLIDGSDADAAGGSAECPLSWFTVETVPRVDLGYVAGQMVVLARGDWKIKIFSYLVLYISCILYIFLHVLHISCICLYIYIFLTLYLLNISYLVWYIYIFYKLFLTGVIYLFWQIGSSHDFWNWKWISLN